MADGGRPRANGGGYNKHWFVKKEKALEYRCGICEKVLKDPQQIVACGDQFCLSCLPSELRKCPACGKDVDANRVFPDESVRKKVAQLLIRCPSKCNWKGTLGVFEAKHKNECPLNLVPCRNQACHELVTRDGLEKHLQEECQLRKIDCRHCTQQITIADEKNHYDRDCLRIPDACPQECHKEIPREEMQNHLENECGNTLVDCTFKNIGCQAQVKRAKLKDHEKDMVHEHLSHAMLVITKLEGDNQRMNGEIQELAMQNEELARIQRDSSEREESRVNQLDSELQEFKQHGTMRLESVQQATEQNFDSLTSLVEQIGEIQETFLFFEHQLNTLMNLTVPQLQAENQAQEVSNKKFTENHETLRRLISVVHNKLTADLKTLTDDLQSTKNTLCKADEAERMLRLENEAKTDEEIFEVNKQVAKNARELMSLNTSLSITKDDIEERCREQAKQMQLDYDNLREKITKEKERREHDVAQLREEGLVNQVMIWRIECIDLKSATPRIGRSFYSESHGYLIRPKIFFDGARLQDQGYLSLFIQLLKGPFDAILSWPFQKNIRFTLIEQESQRLKRDLQKDLTPVSDGDEFRRPTDDANNGFGIYKFVSHEVLQAGRYIVDDVIFVKIEVLSTSEGHSQTI